ncbi:MAG: dienelactone hydrolase family protein [Alphaproteobacteria bacterium]|nr:dienelactone hydrolase family protein [Alphaproteobacteria bacterium]
MKLRFLAAALLAGACATPAPSPPLLAAPSVEEPPRLRTYLPEGKGPHSVVLLVPGCSAPLLSARAAMFERYARKLAKEGYAVALLNYPRGSAATCASAARPEFVAAAIRDALRELGGLPGWSGSRVHLVGWAEGGEGVLQVVMQDERQPGLVSAAVFYPRCPKAVMWKTAVTLFLLMGEKDTVAPAAACRAWAEKSEGPGPVVINRYVGVGHGFDVGEAGDPAYAAYQATGPKLGFDASTAAQAWTDLVRFLKLPLATPQG